MVWICLFLLASTSAAPSSESASFSFHPQEALKRWHPGPFGTFRKDTTPRPPPSKHRPSELCGGGTSKSQSMTFVDTRARNRTFCHEPSLAQPSYCAGGQGGRGDCHTGMREQSKKQHCEHSSVSTDASSTTLRPHHCSLCQS